VERHERRGGRAVGRQRQLADEREPVRGVQLDLLAPRGQDRQRPDRGRVVESIARRGETIDVVDR